MNLLNNKKVLRKLLRQADVLNTLYGGHAQPRVNINKGQESLTIEVDIPGLNSDAFNVMLDYRKLLVTVNIKHPYLEEAVEHPLFARVFQLPPEVDSDRISAAYLKGKLRVNLPFVQQTRQQQRRINIQEQ